ncbi:MAG: WG repeat-containing protein [Prevotellaceae bacterium]|jgi:hypothetical protein|nr:WG repeat-containing protein [Prevotellaceae bacterium]
MKKILRFVVATILLVLITGCKKYDYVFDYSDGMAKVGKGHVYGDDFEKYGYINQTGELVIEVIYDLAYDFQDGVAIVEKDDYYGLIDKKGNEVAPLKYDYAESFSNGFAKVKTGHFYGFINTSGQEIIPARYSEISDFVNSYAKVKKEEKDFVVDVNGNETKVINYSKKSLSLCYPDEWDINELSIPGYFENLTISKGDNSIDVFWGKASGNLTNETVLQAFFSGIRMAGADVKEGKWIDAKYGKYASKSCDIEIFVKYNSYRKIGTVYFLSAGGNKILCIFLQSAINKKNDNQECFDIVEATLNY